MLREISAVPELGYLERHGLQSGAAHIEILPNSLPPDDCDTSESRGRLYVLDLPEPLRVPSGPGPARTLTILIPVRGSQGDFERAVASAAPILDSFEFHGGVTAAGSTEGEAGMRTHNGRATALSLFALAVAVALAGCAADGSTPGRWAT
jgi:hypothetical protein